MPIESCIAKTRQPHTVASLSSDLRQLGVAPGHTLLVHSSCSQLGFVVGGALSVIDALLAVLGPSGTLLMPTHTPNNTEPAHWQQPPVPEAWWPAIRAHSPAFDPARTPAHGMGIMPELFRSQPGVLRSSHPIGSFAAIGAHAQDLLQGHDSLEAMFGEDSPIGRLYALDGYVLLLGVTHLSNTSLHLAEYRAAYSNKRYIKEGTAKQVDGKRRWVEFEMLAVNNDDFEAIGADYAAAHPPDYSAEKVGLADALYMRQRPLVDHAVAWMETHRA